MSSPVLLDTSALLYWTLSPPNLSGRARATLDAASEILISSVSFWEIGIKTRAGKLALPVSLRDYVARVETVERVTILDVGLAEWLLTSELEWKHRDPADRILVATASHRDLSLLTSDGTILKHYAKAVW